MKHESIKGFAEILIGRTEIKNDNILVTESGGKKGTGKSTFSMLLDREIDKQKGFPFDMEEQIIFDPTNKKVIEQVKDKPYGYPIQVDESSKVAYKRNWADTKQKSLIIFANVCRKYYKIINFNNPTFWGLDKDLLGLCDFRIIILKRGIALVMGKISNPDSDDLWLRKEGDEIIKKYSKNQMDVDQAINALRRMPNCIYEIPFGDIEPDIYAKYEKMSQDAELQSFYEADQNIWKIAWEGMINILIASNKGVHLKYNDIAKNLNWYLQVNQTQGLIIKSDRIKKALSNGVALGFEDHLMNQNEIEIDKGKDSEVVVSPSILNINNILEEKSE